MRKVRLFTSAGTVDIDEAWGYLQPHLFPLPSARSTSVRKTPSLFITERKFDPHALGRVQKLPYASLLEFTLEGDGNPLQYSCLENPREGGAWYATVHGVAKSQTRLSDFTSNTEGAGLIPR